MRELEMEPQTRVLLYHDHPVGIDKLLYNGHDTITSIRDTPSSHSPRRGACTVELGCKRCACGQCSVT